jgi:hypothetical protein
MDHKPSLQIDRIAAALATSAGVVWERLDHYPGYMRGMWRDEAKQLIGTLDREFGRPV